MNPAGRREEHRRTWYLLTWMSPARSRARAATLFGVVCTLLVCSELVACSEGGANLEGDEVEKQRRLAPVVVVRPEVRSLHDVFLEREATIFPAAQPRIASPQDGMVKRYVTEVGDMLHEGDLIAELDDTHHRLELAEYRAALMRARATAREVERSFKRSQELFDQNVIAQGTLDDRQSALERARADVLEAKARVERAESDLQELRIVAPIPGVVTVQSSFEGEYLERGDAVAEMKRIDVVYAVCTVNERYIARIREGAPVWIEVTGHPGRQFEGLIWKIVPNVDVASRSIPVKVLIPNTELLLTPGMSARVRFVRELNRALLVPKDAVMADGDARFVLLVRDGVAERREVELGSSVDDRYHVRAAATTCAPVSRGARA
jgi:membrane fusion protein (multidrug efflux system)